MHCVALQFASIWEHLNEFRLWIFSKIRRWCGGGDRQRNSHHLQLLILLTGVITQVQISDFHYLNQGNENGDLTSANLKFSLKKLAISRFQISIFR